MKKSSEQIDFIKQLKTIPEVWFLHSEAFKFISYHKIWKGFLNYGWVTKILWVVGILFSLSAFEIFSHWKKGVFNDHTGVINNSVLMFSEFNQFFHSDLMNWIILLFMAIFIFHCSVKTINILDGRDKKPVLQDFIGAQKRFLKVLIRCFIYESIFVFLANMILSILGFSLLEFAAEFLIHSYFIGFAFFDSYNDQYDFTVKESNSQIKKHFGAVLGIGLVAVMLLKVPLIGAIIAPMLCATATTMYLYGEGVHWPTLPRIFYEDKLKLKPIKEKINLKA